MWQEQVIESDIWEHNGQEYNVKIIVDEYPDLSWLGEYTNRPKWNETGLMIDRYKNGDMGRNEHRYFISTRDLEDERAWFQSHGYSKHESWLLPRQYARRDYARHESFNRGDWFMTTIVVKSVEYTFDDCLSNIESDISEKELTVIVESMIAEIELQIEQEEREREQIAETLLKMGVTTLYSFDD